MRLHLRPISAPSAQVITFPNTGPENREAVIAQLANHQGALCRRHGSYLGRHMFIEAAVAVMARQELEAGADDARASMLEAYDHEMVPMHPASA